MSETSRLVRAASLLREAYGPEPSPIDEPTWSRFLRVLMGLPEGHPAETALSEILRSSPLITPEESASTTAGQLVEVLGPIPSGPQKASVVRAVAAWWVTQFGNETSPDWSNSVSTYRESLRQIRGLGPATVDELLLHAAGLPVFPVDRTALRVAVRHGWLDLPVEDDDAQSFFVQGLEGTSDDRRELSRLLAKVGEAHCGREPNCEGCPLQVMLPEGGPRNPQSC